jgi:hypothetical protein
VNMLRTTPLGARGIRADLAGLREPKGDRWNRQLMLPAHPSQSIKTRESPHAPRKFHALIAAACRRGISEGSSIELGLFRACIRSGGRPGDFSHDATTHP